MNEEAILARLQYYVCTMLLLAAGLVPSAMAQATHITVFSGNGQVICTTCNPVSGHQNFQYEPMIVLVTDDAGNPVANAQVNWTLVSGNGTLQGGLTSAISYTANDGKTQFIPNPYSTGFGGSGNPLDQSAYSAALPTGASVTFYE